MNKREELIDGLADDEQLIFADGFDEAIIGTSYGGSAVVYLFSKAVEILCREMNEEDALEHLYFNVIRIEGENMPIWVMDNMF
jgi:hypothetical protein